MIKEKFDLTGKSALVMGGRGFLGRRFCAALAEFGAKVYSADLPHLSLAAANDHTMTSLEDAGIEQFDCDVTDPASVRQLVEAVSARTPQIDVLVYSVTAKPRDFYKPFTECSLEGWQSALRVELDGLFITTQAVGKLMERAGAGSMIFLSSIYGIVGNDQHIYEGSNLRELYLGDSADDDSAQKQIYAHPVYAAAKGAVISLTRFLAAYWGDNNIRVNCISPGGLAHPGENEQFLQRYSARVPLHRKGGLDEISGAVVYLASDASSYVTGHNLVVDGGWTAW
jgi:NAD(P)-dependent dehydrogenase (short-subunit alcohol dehydrogenase family)